MQAFYMEDTDKTQIDNTYRDRQNKHFIYNKLYISMHIINKYIEFEKYPILLGCDHSRPFTYFKGLLILGWIIVITRHLMQDSPVMMLSFVDIYYQSKFITTSLKIRGMSYSSIHLHFLHNSWLTVGFS